MTAPGPSKKGSRLRAQMFYDSAYADIEKRINDPDDSLAGLNLTPPGRKEIPIDPARAARAAANDGPYENSVLDKIFNTAPGPGRGTGDSSMLSGYYRENTRDRSSGATALSMGDGDQHNKSAALLVRSAPTSPRQSFGYVDVSMVPLSSLGEISALQTPMEKPEASSTRQPLAVQGKVASSVPSTPRKRSKFDEAMVPMARKLRMQAARNSLFSNATSNRLPAGSARTSLDESAISDFSAATPAINSSFLNQAITGTPMQPSARRAINGEAETRRRSLDNSDISGWSAPTSVRNSRLSKAQALARRVSGTPRKLKTTTTSPGAEKNFSSDIKDLHTITDDIYSKFEDLVTTVVEIHGDGLEDRIQEIRDRIHRQDGLIKALTARAAEHDASLDKMKQEQDVARQEREALKSNQDELRKEFEDFKKGTKRGARDMVEEVDGQDESVRRGSKRQKTPVPMRERRISKKTPSGSGTAPRRSGRHTKTPQPTTAGNASNEVEQDEIMSDAPSTTSPPTSVDQMPLNLLQDGVVTPQDQVELPDEVQTLIKAAIDYANVPNKQSKVLNPKHVGSCARCNANNRVSTYAVGAHQTAACKTCTNAGVACLLVNGDGSLTLLPAVSQIRGTGVEYWKAGANEVKKAAKMGVVWEK